MAHERYDCSPGCPVEATLEMIGGKWKGVVLFHLMEGVHRFSELRRKLPSVTQRMLTKQLRELEDAGLVTRTVYPQVPPRVEYSLTDLGQTLRPVIAALKSWGDRHGHMGAAPSSSAA
ncbi:MAG: helix-turn-helix transcriptional regulator [Magnetospirillum sp.]|nr:helix-turn-helix transcriptional regulator [Magnetospirillum sp.]